MALSASQIRSAFDLLSNELAEDGVNADILILGGAALVLLFGARESTKDVDVCILHPEASTVRAAAARIGHRLGLPADWLNDGAKGFLEGHSDGPTLFESPNLVVRTPSMAQLLAMKLSAWRDAIDRSDARLLLSQLDGSATEIWDSVRPFVPPPVIDKATYAFLDLWESVHGPS